MSESMQNKTLANFFYEQCAGSHSGHMAMIPNNPVLFSLIQAATGTNDNCYAASKSEFAKILQQMVYELGPPKTEAQGHQVAKSESYGADVDVLEEDHW